MERNSFIMISWTNLYLHVSNDCSIPHALGKFDLIFL